MSKSWAQSEISFAPQWIFSREREKIVSREDEIPPDPCKRRFHTMGKSPSVGGDFYGNRPSVILPTDFVLLCFLSLSHRLIFYVACVTDSPKTRENM
jgi:hypothetical protein